MPHDDIEVKQLHVANAVIMPEIIDLINQGHTVSLRLRGVSMRPFLEDNRDVAVLTRLREPRVGDVVLAIVPPGYYVLHRIVAVGGDAVTLLGDGNLRTEHCTRGDLKASVEGFYRKGRTTIDRTDGMKWRAYSWLWMRLRPARRYLLAAYRRLWLPLTGRLSSPHSQPLNPL